MIRQSRVRTQKSAMAKSIWEVGNIFRNDIDPDRHCYCQVANATLIVFFAGTHRDEIALDRIPVLPVAFKLWTMKYALTKGGWRYLGKYDVAPENAVEPYFFKQDAFCGRLVLYHSTFAATNYERPAMLSECERLECAAVGDPAHRGQTSCSR